MNLRGSVWEGDKGSIGGRRGRGKKDANTAQISEIQNGYIRKSSHRMKQLET